MKKSKRILCDAIPFCYGPAVALIGVLEKLIENLSEDGYEIDVLSTGSTHELLKKCNFAITLIEKNSENVAELKEINIEEYDFFINVCNPISYDEWENSNCKIVYLDFLLWMYGSSKQSFFQADLYIAENYPGTEEWIQKNKGLIPNLVLNPPIIVQDNSVNQEVRRGDYLLIGLGGQISSMTIPGVNTDYPRLITEIIIESNLNLNRFKKIVIATGENVAKSVTKFLKEVQVDYIEAVSFSHSDFLKQLEICTLFLSHPGLYAPFEAMLKGTPTMFLPPSNYTQILQLRHFRKLGIASYSFSWDDIGNNRIEELLPEDIGVQKVLDKVNKAYSSLKTRELIRDEIEKFINLSNKKLSVLAGLQKNVSLSFGKNGPKAAADKIYEYIKSEE